MAFLIDESQTEYYSCGCNFNKDRIRSWNSGWIPCKDHEKGYSVDKELLKLLARAGKIWPSDKETSEQAYRNSWRIPLFVYTTVLQEEIKEKYESINLL